MSRQWKSIVFLQGADYTTDGFDDMGIDEQIDYMLQWDPDGRVYVESPAGQEDHVYTVVRGAATFELAINYSKGYASLCEVVTSEGKAGRYSPDEHGPLPTGTRVRNKGERFPSAYREGTATVLRTTRKWPDGTYEYDVEKDDGTTASWNNINPTNSWEPPQ